MSSCSPGAAAVAVPRLVPGCGERSTEVSGRDSSSPFLDAAQRKERPDHDRDTLVEALAGDPAPVGEVVGAVGYHYEQWAHVSAFAQGIGVRTRDNPDFTMLSDKTLKPMWSVAVDSRRSAYDASDQRYLVAALDGVASRPRLALDADTGTRKWCRTLGAREVTGVDPFATQILDDEDVAVLGPAGGERVRLARLDHEDGTQEWSRTLDADSGDFLGELGKGRCWWAGIDQYKLFDPSVIARKRAGTAWLSSPTKNGRTLWTRRNAAGADLHVIGTSGSRAVFQDWDSSTKVMRLKALDATGRQLWSTTPGRGQYFDAALRAGRVLVRQENTLSAYDIAAGQRLWSRGLPEKPQFLPYGFELGDVSLLDDDHALLGYDGALRTLDLRTGAMTSAALPTDGINTTYWPYETAVSPGLIAVATNTGAAVVRRE